MPTIAAVPGIRQRSDWFRWALVRLAQRLRTDADYLAAVMSLESGFDPAAVNTYCVQRLHRDPDDCATGLIQFMPQTARALGTTAEALREMSAEDQLTYVERYYQAYTGRLRTAGDAYMATFLPAYIGRPPSYVLARRGTKIYDQNAGLDRDRDGVLTVGDVTLAIEQIYRASVGTRIEVPEEEPPRPKASACGGAHGSP